MSFFEGLVKEEFYLVYENNTSAIFSSSFSLLLSFLTKRSDFTKKEEGSIPPRTPLVIIIIRRKYMRVAGTRRGYDESIIIVVYQ
jgi:hypothetical protein